MRHQIIKTSYIRAERRYIFAAMYDIGPQFIYMIPTYVKLKNIE